MSGIRIKKALFNILLTSSVFTPHELYSAIRKNTPSEDKATITLSSIKNIDSCIKEAQDKQLEILNDSGNQDLIDKSSLDYSSDIEKCSENFK